jgi:6-phosphogluconolactonase
MEPEVRIDSIRALAREFVSRFEEDARGAIGARGRFACALPGGSVAEAFFPALRGARVEWPRVEIFFTDERAVPPDDPESNVALARRLWLDHVPLDPARVHRIPAERDDLEAVATGYAATLASVLGDPPRLDLVLLGVGSDGHVCSLFPGRATLLERARWALAVTDSPKPPPRRVTLTLPALAHAGGIVIAAFGDAKAEVLRDAIEDGASPLPVAQATRLGPRVLFLLDPAAARQLSPR